MADMDIFLPDVESEAIGCPIPRIQRTVRQVVRSFCDETQTWRIADRASVIEDINDVVLLLPQGVAVVTVHNVTLGDRPLLQTSPGQLAHDMPDWRVKRGNPTRFYLDGRDTLWLAPSPDKTELVKLAYEISVKPTPDGNYLDDAWLDRWYETILHGIVGKLQAQRGMPWHDASQAEFNTSMYMSALVDARAHGRGDHVYRGVTTAYGGL